MTAIATFEIHESVYEEVPLKMGMYGFTYMDEWGSQFLVKKEEDGRVMLSVKNYGHYYRHADHDGVQNDPIIKQIESTEYNGSMDGYIPGFSNKTNLDYLYLMFIKNELVGVIQQQILFWKSEAIMGTVEDFVKHCQEIDEHFFEDSGIPTRKATLSDCVLFPLSKVVPERQFKKDDEIGITITTTEKHGKPSGSFMAGWVDNLLK